MQSDLAGEAVLSQRVDEEHAARAGGQLGLVGVEREAKFWLGVRDFEEIDEGWTAALQQVADLDGVGAVGRGPPILDHAVGRRLSEFRLVVGFHQRAPLASSSRRAESRGDPSRRETASNVNVSPFFARKE